MNNAEHSLITTNHEGRALNFKEVERAFDPVGLRDEPPNIGEQRVVETMTGGELELTFDTVHRDAHTLRAHGVKLGAEVTEVAGLFRTARREGRGVEKQHHGTVRYQRAECDASAVLVG